MSEVTIDQWRDRGEILALAGHSLFVIDEGDTALPAVVMIHGFPTASWDWWQIWSELLADYRLIALDLLGFGLSDKPPGHSYSIIEQADIVEELVRHKQLSGFHVLAHDYGDTVAQELLTRQTTGVGAGNWLSLCLLNGGLFPETHRPLVAQKLLLSPIGAIMTRLIGKKKFAASMTRIFGPETPPTQDDIDGFWTLLNHNQGRHQMHRLIGYMAERVRYRERWVGALQQARIPIALINGSLDPISGAHMVDRYLEVVGQPAYLARLDRIGHYPQVEDPAGVIGHYRAFLDSVAPQPGA